MKMPQIHLAENMYPQSEICIAEEVRELAKEKEEVEQVLKVLEKALMLACEQVAQKDTKFFLDPEEYVEKYIEQAKGELGI